MRTLPLLTLLLGLLSSSHLSAQAMPEVPPLRSAQELPPVPSTLRALPEPPDVTLSDEFLVAAPLRAIDEQSPVDLDVRAMTRALDDLHEMKSAMRVVSSVTWFAFSALMLSAGGIMAALITPAPLEPFILTTALVGWGLEAIFRTTVEEDVRNAWRELSIAERHVEYPRYVRHLVAMAEAEQRHMALTSVVGFLMAGLATTAIAASIALDGPLGVVPLGLGVFGAGLVVGFASLATGMAQRILAAFDQGLYTDHEFTITDLDEAEY